MENAGRGGGEGLKCPQMTWAAFFPKPVQPSDPIPQAEPAWPNLVAPWGCVDGGEGLGEALGLPLGLVGVLT